MMVGASGTPDSKLTTSVKLLADILAPEEELEDGCLHHQNEWHHSAPATQQQHSMHAYTIDSAGSAASGRIQYAYHRSSRWTAGSGCGRKNEISMKETHGNSISIPSFGWHQQGQATSSVNCLHHYGVEGTTACQQSSWIHSIRRHSSNSIATSTTQEEELGTPQCGSDEEGYGRA